MAFYRHRDGGAILTEEEARKEWHEAHGNDPFDYLTFYNLYEEVHEDGRPVVTETDRILCLAYGDTKYKYQILDRLRSDCEYYLDAGNRQEKYLWGRNVSDHLDAMRRIYESLPESTRPEWLTLEQINDYAERMGATL